MQHSISVIIPVYNGEKYLAQAIGSVLNQTRPPEEIIVVDDGSTDDSAQTAQNLSGNIRVLRNMHAGVCKARNTGAAKANGKYIAFLDADDLWDKDKLSLQLNALISQPEPDAVICQMKDFISPDLAPDQQKRYIIETQAKTGYCAGCLFISRELFLQTGGFCETQNIFEAAEWFSRFKKAGHTLCILDRLLLHRRIHGTNTMLHKEKEINEAYFKLVRDMLNRRRTD